MKRIKLISFAIFFSLISFGDAARILGIFHFPSKSHHILGSVLLKVLAKKGHEVTMVSPFPFKNKIENYTDINLDGIMKFKEERIDAIIGHNGSSIALLFKLGALIDDLSEIFLTHEEVNRLKSEKFDLIIMAMHFNEAFLGLSHHFNAPVIILNTIGSTPLTNWLTGNSAPISYVFARIPMWNQSTFNERLLNTIFTLTFNVFNYIKNIKQQRLLQKHFPNAPNLYDLIQNVALVFLNSHYSIESPRPYVPNNIPIAGFHVEEPKKLPEDIQSYLDNAQNGAIFFSLGSNVKFKNLPGNVVEEIMNTFSKLPFRVLFKSDENFTTSIQIPPNVKIQKWLPQNDILSHPNVKIFISHGGLLSTIEAVYHGVPIIGIPIFADQKTNVNNVVDLKCAIKIDVEKLNEKALTEAVNEILTNPVYAENMKKRSHLLRSQPIKPLDNAIFWIEHVLENKGAPYLVNAGVNLAWYEYYLVDVILFILLVVTIVIYILRKIVKFVFRKCKRDKIKTN